MRKLLVLLFTMLLAMTLVACDKEGNKVEPPVEPGTPLVPEEPETPEEPEVPVEKEEVLLHNLIMKEALGDIITSASKITYDEIDITVNDFDFKAVGIGLATGKGTGLTGEFILKSDKINIGHILFETTEDLVIEIKAHMWFTTTATHYYGSLLLNNNKLFDNLADEEQAVKLELKAGVHKLQYITNETSNFATQLVLKEINLYKLV